MKTTEQQQAFPWFANYPAGVPQEVDVKQYGSVMELIEERMNRFRDQVAYENMGKQFTYDEIDKLSKDFATFLQQKGLKKGDRIAIQMPNLLQYPIVVFGAIRAGLVIVNTNPLYTPREMAHQFKDSGAKAVVILANFAYNLEKIRSEVPVEHIIVTEIGDMLGGLKGALVNFVVKYFKKMVPKYALPGAISFKRALAQGAAATYQRPDLKYDDVGFLQYTGGTTGVAKGATLTHGNLVANMLQTMAMTDEVLKEGEEVAITALPLYHIFAFTVNCLGMLYYGAKNILITNPRDLKAFIKELNQHPFTFITGVNTLFNALLNHPDFQQVDFSSLKLAIGGGMAVQKPVNDRWKALTGIPIVEGYGLSETSPVLSTNPMDGNHRIGTIGIPVPNTEMAVMDDEGNKLPTGEAGEICARGPQVMKGYWQRKEETDRAFHPGGWFRTGDIGVMDNDGFFSIVDRKKDMILVSGFNVYPNEVEEVIAGHPGVLEVAAIGVPDEKSTEAVKIFVVKKDTNLQRDQLIKYCKEHLTGYKVPRHVEFIDELPKSNVGKIIRRVLREREGL